MADDIALATERVDVAAVDLDSEPIVQRLIEKEAEGVAVRIVTDEDNGDLPGIRRLRRNGISVVEDKRSALMHNKFVVIDDRVAWAGSMNLTSNGVHCNNNNLVRIASAPLAANFAVEMDEMYRDRSFGPRSPRNTPAEKLIIGGVRVENYFAAEAELAPITAGLAREAKQEILFMAFTFTNDEIGEAIVDQALEGVNVRGVFETVGSETDFSYFPVMDTVNIAILEVRQDGNGHNMHHKVLIVDRAMVLFGSANFTNSANASNDESIIIVRDPTFAAPFVDEFENVWLEAAARGNVRAASLDLADIARELNDS